MGAWLTSLKSDLSMKRTLLKGRGRLPEDVLLGLYGTSITWSWGGEEGGKGRKRGRKEERDE